MPQKSIPISGKPKTVATVKPKSKSRRGESNPASRVVPSKYALALLDPFDPNVVGVKIPDQDSSYSFPFFVRQEQTITVDATYGTAAWSAFCDPSSLFVSSNATINATTVTWPANWSSGNAATNISALRSQFSMTRAVAYGLKITTPQSYSVAQGKLHICLCPMNYAETGYSSNFPTTVSQMKTMPGYNYWPLADLIDDNIHCVGKLTDIGAYRYRTISGQWNIFPATITAGVESSPGWYTIIVFVEGATPGTTPISIDFIGHYEGISKASGGLMLNTPPAPYQPQVLADASNAAAYTPFGYSLSDDIAQDFKDLFRQGLRSAAAAGVSYLARQSNQRYLM